MATTPITTAASVIQCMTIMIFGYLGKGGVIVEVRITTTKINRTDKSYVSQPAVTIRTKQKEPHHLTQAAGQGRGCREQNSQVRVLGGDLRGGYAMKPWRANDPGPQNFARLQHRSDKWCRVE